MCYHLMGQCDSSTDRCNEALRRQSHKPCADLKNKKLSRRQQWWWLIVVLLLTVEHKGPLGYYFFMREHIHPETFVNDAPPA